MQVLEEHGTRFGHAVTIGIAQQGDAVGAGHAGTGALHHLLHHHALQAVIPALVGGRVALGHQHVAVG